MPSLPQPRLCRRCCTRGGSAGRTGQHFCSRESGRLDDSSSEPSTSTTASRHTSGTAATRRLDTPAATRRSYQRAASAWMRACARPSHTRLLGTTRERADGMRTASAFTKRKRACRGLKPRLMRVVLSASSGGAGRRGCLCRECEVRAANALVAACERTAKRRARRRGRAHGVSDRPRAQVRAGSLPTAQFSAASGTCTTASARPGAGSGRSTRTHGGDRAACRASVSQIVGRLSCVALLGRSATWLAVSASVSLTAYSLRGARTRAP
jgi:hypothetical protein